MPAPAHPITAPKRLIEGALPLGEINKAGAIFIERRAGRMDQVSTSVRGEASEFGRGLLIRGRGI